MRPSSVQTVQGVYYVASGAWAIVHRPSFEAVSGKKTDYWLVRTVGALTTVIGTTLLVASKRQVVTRESAVLGVGSAVAFGAVDGFYALRHRISHIYLADLAAQAGLLTVLAISARRSR